MDKVPTPKTDTLGVWPSTILPLIKQHGLVGVLVILMAYQIGIFTDASSLMCGV